MMDLSTGPSSQKCLWSECANLDMSVSLTKSQFLGPSLLPSLVVSMLPFRDWSQSKWWLLSVFHGVVKEVKRKNTAEEDEVHTIPEIQMYCRVGGKTMLYVFMCDSLQYVNVFVSECIWKLDQGYWEGWLCSQLWTVDDVGLACQCYTSWYNPFPTFLSP